MTFRLLLLVLISFFLAYAWIEEVDDCTVCRPIYDSTCRGLKKNGCATAKEARVEYTVGLLHQIFPNVPVNSCEFIITCPLRSASRFRTGTEEFPSNVFYQWCEETGENAGKWYTVRNRFTFSKFYTEGVEISSVACKSVN